MTSYSEYIMSTLRNPIMRPHPVLAGIMLLLSGADTNAAGNPVAGEQKAALCIGCHIPGAANADPLIPELSGQHANYIVQELLEYQNGRRKDPVMSALARIITNTEDILDIAAYYSRLPVMSGSGEQLPLFEEGDELFTNSRCNYCHGDTGTPDTPSIEGMPIIGGQNKEYLVKTMKGIRAGERIADKFGLMQKVFSRLSDQDIEALAQFISTLKAVSTPPQSKSYTQ